ncbi:hypothetical protein M885DRAFT_507028 [Pelagophyceae sp. CCMP2097]|nr:hypothetical protein M885DRAFT_507028 [Pelagophyceae sp. CCMP2097]
MAWPGANHRADARAKALLRKIADDPALRQCCAKRGLRTALLGELSAADRNVQRFGETTRWTAGLNHITKTTTRVNAPLVVGGRGAPLVGGRGAAARQNPRPAPETRLLRRESTLIEVLLRDGPDRLLPWRRVLRVALHEVAHCELDGDHDHPSSKAEHAFRALERTLNSEYAVIESKLIADKRLEARAVHAAMRRSAGTAQKAPRWRVLNARLIKSILRCAAAAAAGACLAPVASKRIADAADARRRHEALLRRLRVLL